MSAGRQRGFTYFAILAVVAAMGGVLVAFSEVASHAAQREAERELLFVGQQFRRAIASYHKKGQRYPRSLDELLEDRRFPMPVRHLRQLYRDPITGTLDWGLVKAPDGGIRGVHSLSQETPVKSAGFRDTERAFAEARTYADWQFVHAEASPVGLLQAPPRETRR